MCLMVPVVLQPGIPPASGLSVAPEPEPRGTPACLRCSRRPFRLQSHIQDDSDLHKECDQRCDTVTDERKRDACVRHQPGGNADVQTALEHDQRAHADADEHTLLVPGLHADADAHDRDEEFQKDDDDAAGKAQLFSRDGEDEIRLRLRDEVPVLDGIDGIVVESFAVELAGTDGDDRILLLVCGLRILRGTHW